MEYLVAAYTDIGTQKKTNQDSICVRRAIVPEMGEMILAVVCDGMGGLQKGEVASASAVNAFGRWFDGNLSNLPMICSSGFSRIRQQWTSLIQELHYDILQYSSERKVQLGTTITAFFAYGDRYLTLTVGDSRIYERKSKLRQMTQDQSLVAKEIATGRITEEEGRHHPQRNILLQCVGTGNTVTPVFTEGRVQYDALYLLCTDGFVHEPTSDELAERLCPVLLNSKRTMTDTLCEVTQLCKRRGETDNITAVLLKTNESRCENSAKARPRKLLWVARGYKKSDDFMRHATLIETAQIIHTSEIIGQYRT